MKDLDLQLKAIQAMIAKSGGYSNVDATAPDHVKKAFIEMVVSCPDCRKAMGIEETKS